MYKDIVPHVVFAKTEEAILSFWKERDIFKKSLEKNKGNEVYVFYDGPPFATGLPHFGHFVPGTVKDIIPRYHTMKGKYVQRRFGWDCHGLPVEYEVEKELGVLGKAELERYGVAKFNAHCRKIVQRYTAEWRTIVERLGRWVDFDDDYKTMDIDFMESIWWVFKRLWEKGYIYKGHYILPYSPSLATPLSNFEVNLGGYQQVHDPSLTLRFKLRNAENTYFLAWTTTPWTLPSNQGLAVGQDIEYVKVEDGDVSYILAESRLAHYYQKETEYTIIARYRGADLVGMAYEPLFPYFREQEELGAFRVHSADFVTLEHGTGIVHVAGGFGEDDYNLLCRKAKLPVLCPIDAECRFTHEVPDFEGVFVKDADKLIIAHLKNEGAIVRREQYLHSYPFCYRSKMPLIYRAVDSWFVDVPKIKRNMIEANKKIRWQPEHFKEGRFGKWLENAEEWAISRNRYWGNPLPIWMNEDTSCIEVIGSIAELEAKTGTKITDLHKDKIDELHWDAPDGKGTMRRVPEVLDCWFESGAMPYAQNHYPFENKEHFEQNFPADFISEGLDQTRGWFYTLTVLAAALFDRPAFSNVIVNGLVLAEDGKKMSKSERNFTDPAEVIEKFGADALRLFLMNSSVLKGEDLKYSDESLREETKNFLLPLWSAYSFFVTYANIDKQKPERLDVIQPRHSLDRWILSELSLLIERVDAGLAEYHILRALQELYGFLDLLNNWYIRRSRRRFWKSENDADKQEAYECLYRVLMNFAMLAAPIVPFISEEIYQNLKSPAMPESVHLCAFPRPIYPRDAALETRMSRARRAVSLGRAIRNMHQIKNRQPLKALFLVSQDAEELQTLREMEELLKEELNVKQIHFQKNEEDLVRYRMRPNLRVLGRQLGKKMQEATRRISELSQTEMRSIVDGDRIPLALEGEELLLSTENLLVERIEKEGLKVLNSGSLTIGVDPTLTDELKQEGWVRDIIRIIQTERKVQNFAVTDRINVEITVQNKKILDALQRFRTFLMEETLAEHLAFSGDRSKKSSASNEYTMNNETILIGIERQ